MQSEYELLKGEIFPGILIEKNLYPKIGEEIELESKFGEYVIKYNGIEIGKAKTQIKSKKDKQITLGYI